MSRLGKIKNILKSTNNKIKAFLFRQQWKEALIFFCFFLLALGFWILQSLQQDYIIDINVPLKYSNIPPDIVFSEERPQFVTIKIQDRGTILFNYTFKRSFLPIEIDWEKRTNKNNTLYIDRKEIETSIHKRLLSSTKLVSIDPQQVLLPYSKREKKAVRVHFNGEIKTGSGFKISDTITVRPAKIDAYAGQIALDSIYLAETEYIEIQNPKKTIIKEIKLQAVKGVIFSPDKVTVTIPIEEYTEKILTIPVNYNDLPDNFTVRTFPSSVKIHCNLPISRFKTISEKNFSINIPYSELEKNTSGVLPIHLDKKPDWVDTVKIVPNKVEFIIEQNTND